eukprot:TRINITY_DN12472_c0_g1_i1.p1 TRINITY_DN12472_c0_g1~~TRINITY_DN12472_c0_g1_i1.p1  ORF type:complete len:214 (-),score=31.06 TRINITY_DN12472_c0_g1_i1:254-895(-)
MAFDLPASVPLKVGTMHGAQNSVDVQTTWRIKELREGVRKKFGIPEYEQGYLQGSMRMRSGDLLFPPQGQQLGKPPEIVLVRSTIPSCFSKSQASDLWYSFVAFSDDDGDTVHGGRAIQIARFEGMHELARLVTAQSDLPERFSFVELLGFFSRLKPQLPRATPRRPPTRLEQSFEESLRLDIGNATCPRVESDSSESESDDDDSAEEDLDVD